ncbi:epsp synthase signature 1 [Lucifera butyrica]|uniref:3-phosphoshikimate 1-carboxyvinyltransferase n=1 Tax=Lucifera butyrica TaxID=1351585 RepID=A0A498RD18_9FIRM|nr:3-phosphoshikimate 1-carboxyvinyltransferase [Lucifera butyrica]VBB07963.1 epsp synthase signature 1 [Lucifera butyrica]
MTEKCRRVAPGHNLTGVIDIPGDKSISHRSVMFAGLANSMVRIKNYLFSQDCLSTIHCMKALGVQIEQDDNGVLYVTGHGLEGLSEPRDVLDAGNSGTTMRLLTGILSGQKFFSVLTGDPSLRNRPMARVIKPLAGMGSQIYGRDSSKFAPLAILPSPTGLAGIEYTSPVASAQIKSAVLLAGLFARGRTTVIEPYLSRDHTERMLETFGVPVIRRGNTVSIEPVAALTAPQEIEVPGDISSAAFWLVAAAIIPNSRLTLKNVGINPSRTGILDVLKEMGAAITMDNQRWSGSEPVADLTVTSSSLTGFSIGPAIIPRLVDEIPVLAVAALFAQGRSVIQGAQELRVKETDRLKAVTAELTKMGAKITETDDGLVIEGPQPLNFAVCQSYDDHRMAMSLAIAGTAAKGVEILEPDCVAISYPGFYSTLDAVSNGCCR